MERTMLYNIVNKKINKSMESNHPIPPYLDANWPVGDLDQVSQYHSHPPLYILGRIHRNII